MPGSLEHRALRFGRRFGRGALRAAGSRRVHAALTAMMFALSCWLGARHDAMTTHVRCAEHGELMDTSAPVVAVRAAAADAESSLRSATGEVVTGHQHCAISAATRASRIAPAAPVLAAAPLAVDTRPAAAGERSAVPDRPRYRTAPKTSPPA